MTTDITTDAFEFVEQRSHLIQDALDFVDETREIDETYGREEDSRTRKLGSIEDALKETDLKIVVIGEFSRGKSTLLNALLGDQILPTANPQTTAINTFIYGAEPDEEPYIEIIYNDGKTEELEWSQGVIERWGTELDKENRDARKEVEKILAYTDHPLLQNDLVLIDTPGFEGILPRHEEIAKEAMDDAHVAIWLQSAVQLGGNAREWQFLQDSLATNFHKFLTVINKWDLQINPQDPHEKQKSREQLEREAYETVRQNFVDHCASHLDREEVETLTSEDNLLGVSAIWGMSDNPEKREQSNVDALAHRIEKMCKTGEGEEEMLAGPLRGLQGLQKRLESRIQDERETIEESHDLDELQKRAEKLSHELERLEVEADRRVGDARLEHGDCASEFKERIRSELLEPLSLLEETVETHIDEDEILRKLKNGSKAIGLPDDVHREFERTLQTVDDQWEYIRTDLQDDLEQLAHDFQDKMQKVAGDMTERMTDGALDLPPLEIDLEVDLSSFEERQQEQAEIQSKLESHRAELGEIQSKIHEVGVESERLKALKQEAKREVERQERRLDNLGPAPKPRRKVVTKKVDREGLGGKVVQFFAGRKEVQEVKYDTTAVRQHKARERELEEKRRKKQQQVQEIIDEFHDERKEKREAEEKKRQYQRDLDELKRKKRRAKKKQQKAIRGEAKRLADKLRNLTIRQLRTQKRQLREEVPENIDSLFEQHLQQLEEAVEEQFKEPMETKRDMLRDTEELMQEKEETIENKKRELADLQTKLEELRRNTGALLEEINRVYTE